MDSVDREVLQQAEAWRRSGRRVVLGTVVKTWGSAPRPIGALVAVRDDGAIAGSVSGGCVEDDLIEKVRARSLAADGPGVVDYGLTNEEATRWGLPCGGQLQVVLEPLGESSHLGELLARVDAQQLVMRRLDMKSGLATLREGSREDALSFDGHTLSAPFGPRWRLILIGAGQLSRYVAEMARMLDYQVIVIDPRDEYIEGWSLPAQPHVQLLRGMPDDLVIELKLDGHSAVVALTHDPKLDDMALMEALKSPAFYVGAIGSRRNNDARRKRLPQLDLSADDIARLHGPVGLAIGSRTPPEIALAILAEMTALRRGAIQAAPGHEFAAARA